MPSSAPTTATVDVAVSVSSGVSPRCPLTEEMLQLSPDDRRCFAAQFVWTLKQVPEIRAITVTVNGQRVDLGGSTVISVESFSGFDPAGFAASRQLLRVDRTGSGVGLRDRDHDRAGPMLAVSHDARSAAVEVDRPRPRW